MCPWPGQVDGGGDDSSPSKREMVKLLYQGFEEVRSVCVCVYMGVSDCIALIAALWPLFLSITLLVHSSHSDI